MQDETQKREQKREYDRQWRAKNRERLREYDRARWKQKHPPRPPGRHGYKYATEEEAKRAQAACAKRWREEHPDRARQLSAEYRERNRDAVLAAARARWHAKHGPPRPRGSWRIKYHSEEERASAVRERALAAYHNKRVVINDRRCFLAACRRVLVDPRSEETIRREVLATAASKVVERWRKKREAEIRGKLIRRLRRYFEKAFHAGSKSERVRELLGCTVDELRAHLEKQFQPGMTWENHGYHGWHIDHIKPLASFDLSDPEQQRRAFHFTNLQPLWKEQNFEKRDRQPDKMSG